MSAGLFQTPIRTIKCVSILSHFGYNSFLSFRDMPLARASIAIVDGMQLLAMMQDPG